MYNNLAQYYDYIFPAGQNQLNFFKHMFAEHKINSVLDLACGSGNYSLEFARWGLDVVGVDFEEAMVRLAKQKAVNAGIEQVNFLVGDMRDLSDLQQPFDAIICIGNSLVHLLTDDDLNKALHEMNRLLKPNGLLILQILNYDYIIEKGITTLPDITNQAAGLVFTRQYESRADGLIDFNTALILNDGYKQRSLDTGTVPLRPLRPQELEKFLLNNGFKAANFYGDFKSTPLQIKNHMTLVATTIKG
ncbi:class I SAM-dependent methyltransferase [Peptococcaceae bacterium 1198_IL3148]